MNIRRRTATLAVIATAVSGALATTAAAVLTQSSGKAQIQMKNVAQTDPSTTSLTSWQIPGNAIVSMTVPAGTSQLVNARFAAESACSGATASAYCSVRIIVANGATDVPLEPASDMDFAFDSDEAGTADDMWEAHAVERSIRLGPGSYRIVVQYAVTNPATTFRLDDMHFAVETSAA
jgi:hypothetical protein